MDARRPRRAHRQRRAAAAPAQPAPAPQAAHIVLPPLRLPGPVINPRGPRAQEIFDATWGRGNQNRLAEKEKTGHRFMPLPPRAPSFESTFFEFKDSFKTGDELTDLLLRSMYDDHLNEVGDKRREILQHEWRSSNKTMSVRLKVELEVLVSKVTAKINELAEVANVFVPFPDYFNAYPSLV